MSRARRALQLAALLTVCVAVPAMGATPGKPGRLVVAQSGAGAGIAISDPDPATDDAVVIAPVDGAERPVWSPDGTLIAFTGQGKGTDDADHFQVWVVKPDGTGLRQLTHETGDASPGSFSPDGLRIAYDLYSPNGDRERLMTIGVDGKGRKGLLPFPDADNDLYSPVWSPDGRTIAHVKEDSEGDLWLIDADGRHPRAVALTTGVKESEPSWRPDGRSLAYQLDNSGIAVRSLAGGDPNTLGSGRDPDWSPDGAWVVWQQFNGSSRWQIVRRAPDGSGSIEPVSFDKEIVGSTGPSWQPLCSISGPAKANTLDGTAGPDLICGKGGNDTIDGKGGSNIVFAGPGNDKVKGGPGNDVLVGQTGNDTLAGGTGKDRCVQGPGTGPRLGCES